MDYNTSQFDPYVILGVNRNYTIDELKKSYRSIARRVHPDSGGSEQHFKLVTLAYKKLLEEYKLRQIDRQFNELKFGSRSYIDNQEAVPRQNVQLAQPPQQRDYATGDFRERFNQVYEDHKAEGAYDRGYGDMMVQPGGTREDIDVKKTIRNMKSFHTEFDKAGLNKYNRELVEYREPVALPTSMKGLQYTELGEDRVSDFSGETNNVIFTDYRKAHTTERLIDPSLIRTRTEDYKSIDDLQAHRSNISYELSAEDAQRIALEKAKEERRERRRVEKLKEQDSLAARIHERVNGLMLGFQR